MPRDDLIALVAQLGAPYGLERSVKIVPGALFDDRCLISIHRTALGPTPEETLAAMTRQLGIPAEFAARLPAALDGADIVHFGHEGGPDQEMRKIYFEYAGRARHTMAAGGQRVLVHRAYKWTPGRPAAAAARYTWVACPTRAAVEATLRALLPAGEARRALRCALGLLTCAAALADAGGLMVMEVEEARNPRRSCDLNVYGAAMRVGQIADLLATTITDFAVAPARARAVFDAVQTVALGHLSAGIGRDGGEFVTIYYGVEAH